MLHLVLGNDTDCFHTRLEPLLGMPEVEFIALLHAIHSPLFFERDCINPATSGGRIPGAPRKRYPLKRARRKEREPSRQEYYILFI
jgi:hypothetical protein